MLGWLRRNPTKSDRLGERITEMLREVGILLMVFAPLDFFFSNRTKQEQAGALYLFGLAFVLWLLGVVVEWIWRE